ncbi:CREB-binding protein isoform X1 [Harpegnathos saltator]|uniref:CREB-binding protein isoform X1 n=1 Tax=Harpegnathos saltator TaxID=610380 RepID=UPI000DBEDF07|nr:CREB-binding protein isoform X1 [Harpegnathos saltator]
MSESETKPASPIPTVTCAQCCASGGLATSQCPTLQVTSRMLRSPSHESVTTDLSLFSVSSIASELRGTNRLVTFKSYSDVQLAGRGPSPKPDSSRQIQGNRPADIPEILWFEEENELIRSCGVLSSALGLRKSFSTSDVSQLPSPDASGPGGGLRTAVSALALDTAQRNTLLLEHARLDHTSRSCSTWVAVGEPVASTSQLPSPHGGAAQEQQQPQPQQQQQHQQLLLQQQPQQSSSSSPQSMPQQPPPQPPAPPPPPVPFTGADLVRSVNKKVADHVSRFRAPLAERIQPGPAGGGGHRGADLARSYSACSWSGRRSAQCFFDRTQRAESRADCPGRRKGTWESVVQIREEHDDLQLASHSRRQRGRRQRRIKDKEKQRFLPTPTMCATYCA